MRRHGIDEYSARKKCLDENTELKLKLKDE
jgi:hypothetical protein